MLYLHLLPNVRGRWQMARLYYAEETTTWSGRARYSNKTAWMYYSNVFMIREVEVRCAHILMLI